MKTMTTAAVPGAPARGKSLARWSRGAGGMRRGILSRSWPLMICAALATAASAQTEQVIQNLGGTKGDLPESNGSLLILPSGHVIGTAMGGSKEVNEGLGVVFEAIPPAAGESAWTYHVIHRFQGGGDGSSPANGLAQGKDGVLYGLTAWGGETNCGVVYQMTKPTKSGTGTWEEAVLYTFGQNGAPDGCKPENTQLLFDKKTGSLYGTTELGGTGYGTFFRLDPPQSSSDVWHESLLHEFSGELDGGYPTGGLAGDPEGGIIYGTAQIGGYGYGMVWQYNTTTGELTPAYYFAGGSDGAKPEGGVIGPFPGNVYGSEIYLLGTTAAGGGSSNCGGGCGTVFAINIPAGQAVTDSILHAFQGTDGDEPVSGMVMSGSAAWGTALSGGGSANCGGFGCGTLFKIQLSGFTHIELTYAPVYNFVGGAGDGEFPETGLVGDSSGNVIGMTAAGGANAAGTLFEYVP